jgi:hypothetical protein
MRVTKVLILILAIGLLPSLDLWPKTVFTQSSDLALPQEKHLRNVRQLTFAGENAEAYFSADGKKLIFQSTRDGYGCDLIYTMNIDGSDISFRMGNACCIRRPTSHRLNVRHGQTIPRDTSGRFILRMTFLPPSLTDRI